MREIGTLPSEPLAIRLTSYLRTQSIPATVTEEDGQWVIWVQNDDDRDRSKTILEQFQASPDSAEYTAAITTARQLQKAADDEIESRRRHQVDIRKRWNGSWWHQYPATGIMIGICLLVIALCTDWQRAQRGMAGMPMTCNDETSALRNLLFSQAPRQIISTDRGDFALFGETDLSRTLQSGQLWRLVTPVFLHFGVLHILFNMMWLRNLGGAIEFVRGTRRFLLLFLLLAVISNVAQLLWSGPRFGGMSGVVFGLIGYVWMKGRTQPHLGLGLTSDQIVYSVLWLVLCMGGAMGNIANAAHLAGFIAGILVGSRHALIRKLRHILQ
jgi:GlpG protein